MFRQQSKSTHYIQKRREHKSFETNAVNMLQTKIQIKSCLKVLIFKKFVRNPNHETVSKIQNQHFRNLLIKETFRNKFKKEKRLTSVSLAGPILAVTNPISSSERPSGRLRSTAAQERISPPLTTF